MEEKNSVSQNDDQIHVAIIRWDLADDYNRHTAATMVSVLENCSKCVTFHILYSLPNGGDTDKINRIIDKYLETTQKYGANVIFHLVKLDDNILQLPTIQRGIKEWGTPVGLFRLYFPTIISNVDRIISLGSDVIVDTDLAKVITLLPEDYSLAGCYDSGLEHYPRLNRYCHSIGIIDTSHYVNADVLIFNLKKIRSEQTLPARGLECLMINKDIHALEQDILNIIFKNDIYLLPKRYNIFVNDVGYVDSMLASIGHKKDYILHYCSRPKPWVEYHSKYDMEYWYYLSHTAWGDNDKIFQLMPCALTSRDQMLNRLYRYIWELPAIKKLKTLWKLTFPLYFNIGGKYLYQLKDKIVSCRLHK